MKQQRADHEDARRRVPLECREEAVDERKVREVIYLELKNNCQK